ncbi:hypothetical protein L0F63_003591, partial [Massospora cicadina]
QVVDEARPIRAFESSLIARSGCASRPSSDTWAALLLGDATEGKLPTSYGTDSVSLEVDGSSTGRKLRERGRMGGQRMALDGGMDDRPP